MGKDEKSKSALKDLYLTNKMHKHDVDIVLIEPIDEILDHATGRGMEHSLFDRAILPLLKDRQGVSARVS